MYIVNEDNSIYVTRGDIVLLDVEAKQNGKPYTFQPGELLRIKVSKKKKCNEVVLQKDFPVTDYTQKEQLYLSGEDTKIGDVISKPVDYWYEVELNPDTEPQTIIGYDEDGAKIFKLFPEGADVSTYVPDEDDIAAKYTDDELDLTSRKPVENRVVARAVARIEKLCEDTFEAVAKLHVTPQMFGAIGDGKADDTEAIISAISTGETVVFMQGVYRVTRTLSVDKYIHIVGKGEVTIKYEGEGFLFDVTTEYRRPAIIENIKFEGLTTNSFLKCGRNGWGASVRVLNCWVQKFDNEVLRFESVFRVAVEKVTFQSKGKAVITSYDGVAGNSNFNNCIDFCDCAFLRYDADNVPKMFELTNVIQITFSNCSFDHIDLIFDCIDRVNMLTLNGCWLEYIGAVYSLYASASTLDKPTLNRCNYVSVAKVDVNDTDLTNTTADNILSVLGASTNTLNTLHSSENRELVHHYAYNLRDSYSQFTPIFSIGTRKSTFNSAINTETITESNVTSVSKNLKEIARYSNTNCIFDVVLAVTYEDTSIVLYTCKIGYYGTVFFTGNLQELNRMSWGGATAETNKISLSVSNNVLNVSSPAKMNKCSLSITHNYLC
jgi:hypothetical protein